MTLADVAPPLEPDAAEAKQWLLDELSGADYVQARPTWFDQLASWLGDLIASFRPDAATGLPGVGTLIVIALIAAAIVVAFLVFGVPRLRRRSSIDGSLFGEDDDRSADEMRRAALDAASAGDFSTAVLEMFRAIARSLAERTVVTVVPGTTARGFAGRAALAFPDQTVALTDAARAFDAVRYLGRTGTPEQFATIRELDERVRAARPLLPEAVEA
jgi:signal transduction histidine kinase